MTIIEQIQERVSEVGGLCWIDEFLIRADANGIRGAHVKLEWRAPDAVGGQSGGTVGPFPVSILAEDPLWQKVCESINLKNLETIEDLQAQIQNLESQLVLQNNNE